MADAKCFEQHHPAAVVEAALMVETGSWRRYDQLVVVSCAPEVQLARVMARDGLSREEAQSRLDAQMPMAEKERVASVVVRNDGGREALVEGVVSAWVEVAPVT